MTRKEKALSVVDKIEWEVEAVECDDYGNKEWKWHVTFVMDLNGTRHELYDDYYRKKPNDMTIYNNMIECIKDGSMAERIEDVLTQEDAE